MLRAQLVAFAFVLALLGGCSSETDAGSNATQSDSVVQAPVVPDSIPADAGSAPLQEATNKVQAPDFKLQTMDGKTFNLADHKGKVIVLNFWATWCPPCRQEIPDFNKLQKELGNQGLQIVGISLDQEGPDVVREYMKEMPFNYPVMHDDGTAQGIYGPVQVMPTTFIIDRSGNARFYAGGMLTDEALRPVLIELLKEKAG